MNRVADKNGVIARRATQVAAATRYRAAAVCGSSRGQPIPHRRFAHRVLAVVILRCQGAQHSERPFLLQPSWALALRAVCGVRLLAKARPRHVTAQQPFAGATAGDHSRTRRFAHRVMVATIRVVAFLACSLADTLLRSSRLREARRGRHSRTRGSRAHRVMPPTPQSRMRGHAGLNQRFLNRIHLS